MAFQHGKSAVVKLNSVDLSAFSTDIKVTRTADSHDVTTFGKSAHVYKGGLLDGDVTISGIYDTGTSGPRKTIEPLIGTTTAFLYQPEGTGSTKPQDSVTVLVASYEETTPVADMISWSVKLQMSDTDDVTAQT